MRITVIAVGRAKPGPEKDLYDNYARRITIPFDLKEVEEKKPLSGLELKRREAELILARVPDGAMLVALDETGKTLTSPAFAQKLGGWRDQSIREIVFVIGGADGLDSSVRKRANLVMCFGAMTWPHMLVRGMLAEQIYRGLSILAGHPYHRV